MAKQVIQPLLFGFLLKYEVACATNSKSDKSDLYS